MRCYFACAEVCIDRRLSMIGGGWLAELLLKRALAVEATEMGAELHLQGEGRRRAWFIPSTDTHKPLAWVCKQACIVSSTTTTTTTTTTTRKNSIHR